MQNPVAPASSGANPTIDAGGRDASPSTDHERRLVRISVLVG